MGRAGIGEFQIMTAATELHERLGRVPKNLEVLDALGEGSLSTISPVMKKYRARFQGEANQPKARAALVNAVEEVYAALAAEINADNRVVVDSLNDDVAALSDQLDIYKKELEAVKKQLSDAQSALRVERNIVTNANTTIENLKEKLDRSERNANDARLAAAERLESISLLKSEAALERQANDKARNEMTQSFEKSMVGKQAELEAMTAQIVAVNVKLDALRAEKDQIRTERDECRAELTKKAAEAQATAASLNDASQLIKTLERDLREAIENASAEGVARTTAIQESKEEIQSLKHKNELIEAKYITEHEHVSTLQELVKSLKGASSKAKGKAN